MDAVMSGTGAKKARKKLSALPLKSLPTHSMIVDQARRYAPECIQALADEMENNTGAPRVAAARELLDRGYGKVGQPVELTGRDGGPVGVSVEISAEILEILQTVRGKEER